MTSPGCRSGPNHTGSKTDELDPQEHREWYIERIKIDHVGQDDFREDQIRSEYDPATADYRAVELCSIECDTEQDENGDDDEHPCADPMVPFDESVEL